MRKKDNISVLKTDAGFDETDIPEEDQAPPPPKKANKSKVNYNLSRQNHNECEKSRRAIQRKYFEKLQEAVPVGQDEQRHTTLGLLKKAKRFIRALEIKEKKYQSMRDELKREQRFLKRRLDQLQNINNVVTPPPPPQAQPPPEISQAFLEIIPPANAPLILRRKPMVVVAENPDPLPVEPDPAIKVSIDERAECEPNDQIWLLDTLNDPDEDRLYENLMSMSNA